MILVRFERRIYGNINLNLKIVCQEKHPVFNLFIKFTSKIPFKVLKFVAFVISFSHMDVFIYDIIKALDIFPNKSTQRLIILLSKCILYATKVALI